MTPTSAEMAVGKDEVRAEQVSRIDATYQSRSLPSLKMGEGEEGIVK